VRTKKNFIFQTRINTYALILEKALQKHYRESLLQKLLCSADKTDAASIALGCWNRLYYRLNAHFVFLYFLRFLYTE